MNCSNLNKSMGLDKMADEFFEENDPELSLISDFSMYHEDVMKIEAVINQKLKVYHTIYDFPIELVFLLQAGLDTVFCNYENLRDRLLISMYSTNEKLNDIFKCKDSSMTIYWLYAEKLDKIRERLSFYDFTRDLLFYMRTIVKGRYCS